VSTIGQIKTAKGDYEDHVSGHKCVTGDRCPERIRLWLRYMKVSEAWSGEETPWPN
jgi:hypothetical protein